jgi:hypothetical protein
MVNRVITIFPWIGERRRKVGLRRLGVPIIAVAAAGLGVGAPAKAASVNAQAKAKVVKPIALSAIQDLDLGTVILSPGTWSGAIVALSRGGALSCPANVTCSGATQVAQYNITGSNNQVIIINAPDVTMTNLSDSTKTLTLVVDGPGTITLPNSGNVGINFPLGGSVTVDSSTAEGTYSGTFQVTAEYQ